MVGIFDGCCGDENGADTGEEDVGGVGIGAKATLTSQAAQPEDGGV